MLFNRLPLPEPQGCSFNGRSQEPWVEANREARTVEGRQFSRQEAGVQNRPWGQAGSLPSPALPTGLLEGR